MTRVVVIGPSGSGKTRLSAGLAEALHARHVEIDRLRSDAEVKAFVQSIQATESMSGSSKGSELQKMPPFADT